MLKALHLISPFLDAEMESLKTEIETLEQRWGGIVIKTAVETLTNHYDESVGSIEVLRGDNIEKYVNVCRVGLSPERAPCLPWLLHLHPCSQEMVGVHFHCLQDVVWAVGCSVTCGVWCAGRCFGSIPACSPLTSAKSEISTTLSPTSSTSPGSRTLNEGSLVL